jgi:hypothetical protein
LQGPQAPAGHEIAGYSLNKPVELHHTIKKGEENGRYSSSF